MHIVLNSFSINERCTPYPEELTQRGSIMGFFFTSFVKNSEIKSSVSFKIILEQQDERNQLNS